MNEPNFGNDKTEAAAGDCGRLRERLAHAKRVSYNSEFVRTAATSNSGLTSSTRDSA
jgi:hypothetical protein